jgi:hypothetical protein
VNGTSALVSAQQPLNNRKQQQQQQQQQRKKPSLKTYIQSCIAAAQSSNDATSSRATGAGAASRLAGAHHWHWRAHNVRASLVDARSYVTIVIVIVIVIIVCVFNVVDDCVLSMCQLLCFELIMSLQKNNNNNTQNRRRVNNCTTVHLVQRNVWSNEKR